MKARENGFRLLMLLVLGIIIFTYTGIARAFSGFGLSNIFTLNTSRQPSIYVWPTSLNFGTVFVGSTSTKNLWIKNLGTDTLRIFNISVADTQFIVSEKNFKVASGDSHLVEVTFRPAYPNTAESGLTITSNDPIHEAVQVGLFGIGMEQYQPQISVNPTSLNFGTVMLNHSQTLNLWVGNVGDRMLNVSNITSSNEQFTVDINYFTVEPGLAQLVRVTFRPIRTGSVEAALTIYSDDPVNSKLNVPLYGTGSQVQNPKISVTPDSLYFGTVAIGHSQTQYLWVSNSGAATLQVSNITSSNAQFTVTPQTFSLASGYTQLLYVTYSPTYVGLNEAWLIIFSNDPEAPTIRVPLVGIGRELKNQQISVSPTSLDFGTVAIGSSRTLNLWITNLGEKTLTVSNVRSDSSQFIPDARAFFVYPGESYLVGVTFSPTRIGQIEARLTITSDDPVNEVVRVPLQGSGRRLNPPQISVSPKRLEFGTVATGRSVTQSLWVSNLGEETLTVTNIFADNSQFAATPTNFSVAPARSQRVWVTFTPLNIGSFQDSLIIQSNSQFHDIFKVYMSGTGRKPTPQQISVTPESINFGAIPVGYYESRNLWISNVGETALTVFSISPSDNQFSVSASSFTVAPGSSKLVIVTFHPVRQDTFLAELTIHSDDAEHNYLQVDVYGRGRALFAQNISLNPDSLNFGAVAVGRSQTQYFWVSNQGEMVLNVSTITSNSDRFVPNLGSFSVAPGHSQMVAVTFSPSRLDTFRARLTIQSNDPDQGTVYLGLFGIGRELRQQKIAVNPDSLNFGAVAVGRESTQQFWVYNQGEVPLNVSNITSNNGQFTVNTTGFTVEPSGSHLVRVTFLPVALGTFQASLTITSNDPQKETVPVKLIGTGRELLAQQIQVSPDSLDFGAVAVGRSLTRELWVSNPGEVPLMVSFIASSDSQFIISPTSFSVTPGSSQEVMVTFQPIRLDTFVAQITFFSNDPGNYAYKIGVRGIGREIMDQQISVNPQALQFGVVGLGRWQAQNLWVRNLGDRVLKVSDIVSSDGQFTVNITNFTVEPGQSYPVTVTFRPVQADTIIANLTIYSDDPVTRSLQVGLFGRGRQLYEQQISVTPDSLYFGTVATTRSSAQYLWVSNLGEEPLTIFNIRTSNSQFTVSDTSFSIVPGASRLIMVNFRPAQVGAVHAALLIISDDPVNDSLYVALYGIGREPHPQQISLNPETLNFGTVLVNQSRTQYLWVANEGDLTLTVSRIVSSDNQFTVQDTSFAVGPEGSHSVAVTFRPTHAGTIEASLTIFSDDPERKSLSVPLFGKATTDTVAGDWHLLTDQGDTYNEDVLIDFSDDLYAKVWCFYLRSAGAGQPVYMKVFRLSQTQPPSEQTVGYGTNLQQNEYQTVRACLNKVTGDVWVAIQGSDRSGNRGYFVVYDSTAKLKREPTWIPSSLGSQTNYPRIACDSHGRMWLNWVSGSPGQANAQGEYICYNPNGTVYLGPQTFTSTGYVNSTDIAIDSNDRVWMLFNQAGNRQYFTILNNNGTVFKPATLYAENTFQFDNRRQVFADVNNERVWILRRNANVENQALRIYDLNGNPIAQVSPVGHCSFVTNEKNRLEVVQYKNQKYQVAEFHPRHGGLFTNWTTLFDSTYAPVTNGLACNWANPRLKAYLAQTDTHVTKAYFQYVMSHVPIISVLPRTLDFGEVTVGTSRSDTLWVRNLGTDSLRITKLAVSNAQFTVNKTPFVLAPGKTRSLLVTFLPNKPDTVGATLTISSNDPMNEEVFVPLFGMGFITKGPQIAVAPAHLEFGEVAQGKSATMQLRVTNLGGDTLKVTAIASSDTQFVVTDKTFKVPSQQSHLVAVMFRPAKLGKITGTLTIRNNDPRNDSLKVPVSGTGRTFRNQQIVIEPDTLRFGRVALGRSQTLYVTISNPGDTTLQIYYIAISDTAQFTVYPASFEVASNGYRTIAVTFRPDTIGAISGTVTIYSNDPDSKRKRLQLPVSGTGYRYEGPLIVVNPEFLNFGTLVAGGSRRLPLYVKNTGKRELRVSNIYFSYTYDNPYSVDQTNFKVAQGDSKRVWVTFHPTTSTWTTNNILYISSNDSTNLVAQVPLTGSVEQAALNSLNWNLGYAPFGTPGSTGIPYPYTSGVLDAVPDTAWFIKDIYLSSPPTTAMLYVAYDDLLQLYINGRQVLNRTVSTDTMKYWSDSLRVESFLVTGVNRIAAVVYNIAAQGGFDCQLLVNGVPRIKEGRVHYGASETQWWYLTNGALLTADAFGRQWFSFDYGLTSSDSVVARWTFDESFGDTLQDASRFGRRGIKHGTSVVTGVVGNGLLFDGLDDYVQIETNIDHVPLTLQVWINCSGATAGRQTIISNEQRDTHGHGIFLNESLRLGVQYHGPQGQTGERVTNYTIQPNTWYFLTVQYIGNMVKIYVNGVPVDSVTYTPTTPDAYTYTFIGRNPALETNPRMFKGKIDEVAILNVATRVTGVPQVAKILKPESLVGELGSELKMVFPLHPNPLRVLRGRFRYAVGGSSNFQTPDITEVTDSTVTMTIPKDKVTLRGLKCRLELETSLGKITYPPASSADTLFWVKTHTSGEKSAMHLKGERYRMISVPFQLEDSDINAVLKDDLGEQSPYDWRLFQWEPSSGRYLEFPSTLWGTQRGFKRGQAFWLITWLDKTFDTGAGWSADNIEPFPILLYPGWNQIADPFPFPVAWDSVEANGHISDLVYYVSQDTIGYHRHWKILEPWEGYFVYNNEPYPVTLYVPPIESGAQLPKSPGQFAMNLHAEGDWKLALNIGARCDNYIDPDNLIGITEGVSNFWDYQDALESPPIGNYIGLWIDNSSWQERAGHYAVDLRSPGERGYVWNLMAAGQLPEVKGEFHITFGKIADQLEEEQIFLFDLEDEIALNLRQETAYTFNVPQDGSFQRKFKLVVGDEEFVRQQGEGIPLQPLSFELLQNYPNPFSAHGGSPATVIQFTLPKKAHTKLIIYNILGQRVRTLINEPRRAGRHQLRWDGTNDQGMVVANGLYFLRLQAEDRVQVRKMTLLR